MISFLRRLFRRPPPPNPDGLDDLRHDFAVTMQHFGAQFEDGSGILVAWEQALLDPERAKRCYSAIARSLR